MIQTINLSDFRDAFKACGRQDQFSYEGLNALFGYIEGVNPDYNLDVIELCCEYSEETTAQIADSYGLALSGNEDADADQVRDYLNDHTSIVAEIEGRFLYAQF